jgi:hypothetical protein
MSQIVPHFLPSAIDDPLLEDVTNLIPAFTSALIPNQTHELYGNLHILPLGDPLDRIVNQHAADKAEMQHEAVNQRENRQEAEDIELQEDEAKVVQAAQIGNLDDLETLLPFVSINQTNALLMAASHGQSRACHILVDNGALVDKMDDDLSTPLLLAALNGHAETAEFLISRQADIHHTDKEGFTSLHLAASRNHLNLVKLLLSKGVQIDGQTKRGLTALMLAAAQGHVSLVEWLLEKGASVLVQQRNGESVYDSALQSENLTLAELIERMEKKQVTKVSKETRQHPQYLHPNHQTRPVVVYELQRSTLLSPRSFSTANLGKQDKHWSLVSGRAVTSRAAVELPPATRDRSGDLKRTWYWLSEWKLDNKQTDGWEYSRNGDEWLPTLPRNVGGLAQVVGGTGWYRRRRWFRIMKKRSENDPGIVQLASSDQVLDLNYMERAKQHNQLDVEGVLQILLSGMQSDQNEARKTTASIWANHLLADLEDKLEQAPPQSAQHTQSSQLKESVSTKWQLDEQVTECNGCKRPFGLLLRKHHCRMCGLIFCADCSKYRHAMGLATVRVCNACRPDVKGIPRTDSRQSLMSDCPSCGKSLLDLTQTQREEHLTDCLNSSSSMVGDRYVVRTLLENPRRECEICFEELLPTQKVAVLSCLCIYHEACASSWFSRGKTCPIHHPS